jgi:hypothetical protein
MDPTTTILPRPNGTLAQISCVHHTIDDSREPDSPCNSNRWCTLTWWRPWPESRLSTCHVLTASLKGSTRGGNDNKSLERVLADGGALSELVHDVMQRCNSVEKFWGGLTFNSAWWSRSQLQRYTGKPRGPSRCTRRRRNQTLLPRRNTHTLSLSFSLSRSPVRGLDTVMCGSSMAKGAALVIYGCGQWPNGAWGTPPAGMPDGGRGRPL